MVRSNLIGYYGADLSFSFTSMYFYHLVIDLKYSHHVIVAYLSYGLAVLFSNILSMIEWVCVGLTK